MRVLRLDGVIAAPRERLFALIEDPRLADDLHPPFLRTTVASAPWLPKAGGRTRVMLTYRGARFDLETEIQEYRRGSFLLERQVAGPFASLEHAVHLEDGAEGTRLTEVLAYALPLGLLGKLFDAVTLRRDLEAILVHRQTRLREMLA